MGSLDRLRLPHTPGLYFSLLWCHNGRDGFSKHQPHDRLLNRLFTRRSKKTSTLRDIGLFVGNSPVTGGFPAQMASNVENVSIWWRHHGTNFTNGLWAHNPTLLKVHNFLTRQIVIPSVYYFALANSTPLSRQVKLLHLKDITEQQIKYISHEFNRDLIGI